MLLENDIKALINEKTLLINSFDINDKDIYISNEVKIENGIKIDHVVYNQNDEAVLLIESKGGDIGITEFLRGIGQITQYQSHIEKNKVLKYDRNCISILAFPDELYRKIDDLEQLEYPQNTKLLIINSVNKSASVIVPKKSKGSESFKEVVKISPYYLRDNRIGELYIGLLELKKRSISQNDKVDRNMDDLFNSLNTPNRANSRNVCITLSSLGLIDSNNILTQTGYRYSLMGYNNFLLSTLNDFFYPYINSILYAVLRNFYPNEKGNYVLSWTDLRNVLIEMYGKEVEFLTESENRYISSWCSVLKNDIGCIDFESNKRIKEMSIKFLPLTGNFYRETSKIQTPNYVKKYTENHSES